MARRRRSHFVLLILFIVSNVRVSAKRYIEFLEEPSDILVVRNQPAELRCNVSHHGNVKITWMKDGVILDLSNDTRRSIDAHGALKFSKIIRQKRNSPDEGVYKCRVTTTVNGNSYLMVSRGAKLVVVGMSKSFSERPSDLLVNEGETAIFKCQLKRCRPPAKITWSIAGRNTDPTFNSRFVVLPSGVLEIHSVMRSDAGDYVCKATNEKTGKFVEARANLTVNPASTSAKPTKFIVKPKDVLTLNNKDLILECVVTGYPTPHATWRKDGQKLTLVPDGHYAPYGANNLKITSVQPADAGKYECVIGLRKAKANVQVIVPPQWLNQQLEITTLEEEDIKMRCDVTGFPTPTLSWYYNGNSVARSDYITVKNNTLYLMEALDEDEGIYQCFARNAGGEIQTSVQLVVLTDEDLVTTPSPTTLPSTTQPPTVPTTTRATTLAVTTPKGLAPSAPQKVMARKLNSTIVVVSWQPPEKPHGTISGYTLVTQNVDTDQVNSMLTTTQTLLKVDKLTPATTYEFYVYATNENGGGEISHHARARTDALPTLKPPKIVTGPVRNVKVEAIRSVALKVTWTAPDFIAASIQNYTIKYKNLDRKTPAQFTSTMKLEVTLLKLSPYTQYSVEVTAFSLNGAGKTSSAVVGRTKSGKPKGPPEKVKFGLMKNVVVAQWEEPSQPNGNITEYVMNLKNKKSNKVTKLTTTKTNKVFTNLEKSTTYFFRVAAVTEGGRGEFSHWIAVSMPSKPLTENVVPGKPTNLRAQVLQGMIRVTWNPPAERHIVVREYILSYGPGAPGYKYQYLQKNVTSSLLQNLQAGSIYVINLWAKNKKGEGERVYADVTIVDKTHKPGNKLYNLQALPAEKKALKLSWRDPITILTPHAVYNIKFEKDNRWVYRNTSKKTHLVEDLKPGTIYKFFIKRDNQDNFETVSNSTRDEEPSPPKDLNVEISAENFHMMVHWNIPDNLNGKLLNYKICWKEQEEAVVNWTCKVIKGTGLNCKISGIKENVTYVAKISAINAAGEGQFSELKTFSRGGGIISSTPGPTTSDVQTPGKSIETSTASLTSNEKILWIIIAIIASITLVAIVVISVILCKKRAGGSSFTRKKPPADAYKVVANGSVKKKGSKDNYWIKQNGMELESFDKKGKGEDASVAPTIPRNADEMKPLDSPFHSRKYQNTPLMDESDRESLPPIANDRVSPSSFNDPSRNSKENLEEPYLPLPAVAPKPKSMNIYNSPFPQQSDDFPAPPTEVLDNDDGRATSSDYGSEEIVAPSTSTPSHPPVSYMPRKSSNGYVSVATDYEYPPEDNTDDIRDSAALQSLIDDLDAIMAIKEDRV